VVRVLVLLAAVISAAAAVVWGRADARARHDRPRVQTLVFDPEPTGGGAGPVSDPVERTAIESVANAPSGSSSAPIAPSRGGDGTARSRAVLGGGWQRPGVAPLLQGDGHGILGVDKETQRAEIFRQLKPTLMTCYREIQERHPGIEIDTTIAMQLSWVAGTGYVTYAAELDDASMGDEGYADCVAQGANTLVLPYDVGDGEKDVSMRVSLRQRP
jgi:hypothetical protein